MSDGRRQARRNWRTPLFVVLMTAGVCATSELLSAIAYRATAGEWFSYAALRQAEQTVVGAGGQPPGAETAGFEVLHPYLGYVYNPRVESPEIEAAHASTRRVTPGLNVNDFGFIDEGPSVRKRAPDRVIVGVFGGSVAVRVSALGKNALLAQLRTIPAFAGKQIEIVRAALGGYKQPQQLLALSYLLALGAEFDVVLNIDGFNEVALPPAENVPSGVFPFYPRGWADRVVSVPDPGVAHRQAIVVGLEERRRELASSLLASPFRHSVTASVIWWLRDRQLQTRLGAEQATLLGLDRHTHGYVATGPARDYSHNAASLYEDLANVWAASSLQMHRLCTQNGARYFHFLQPNQYVPDSKPLSTEERAKFVTEGHGNQKGVVAGYPVLIARGRELRQWGVAFHDLSRLFAQTPETMYKDDCCHYNQTGNDLVASTIGRSVAEALSQPQAPERSSDVRGAPEAIDQP